MTTFRRAAIVFLACFPLVPAWAAWQETDEVVKSRGEVKVQFLVARALEKDAPVEPKHIAVFFPGAAGTVRPARAGVSEHGANPATMGVLAEQFGMGVAIGLPSDQPKGIDIDWRLGAAHLADAGAIIDYLTARYPAARLTLIGMSNGARSVTAVAGAIARRGTPKIQGVVVMSAAPEAIADDVMKPITEAKIPVLVAHHKRDSCLLFRDIEAPAQRYTFVVLDDAKMPRPNGFIRDCNPGSAHVFAGKTRQIYSLIADWAKTGKYTPPE